MKRLSLFVSLAALALCLAVAARHALAQSYGMYPALTLPLSVSYGGTGLSSYTNAYPGGFVCVSSTWALTQMPSMGPGGLPIGTAVNSVASTGTLTAGGSITITNAAGSITVAVTTLGVDSTKMGNASVDSEKLAKNAVNGEKVQALALDSTKMGNASVDSEKLAKNAVNGEKVQALTLDSTKLAARSVDSEKVVLASIGREHVANLTLDSAKLAARSVDSEKVALLSIGKAHLTASAVETSKLASDAVTPSKVLYSGPYVMRSISGVSSDGGMYVGSALTSPSSITVTGIQARAMGDGFGLNIVGRASDGAGVLNLLANDAASEHMALVGLAGNASLRVGASNETVQKWSSSARGGNSFIVPVTFPLGSTVTVAGAASIGGNLSVGAVTAATRLHISTGVATIDGNASGLVISSGATTGAVVLGIIDTSKSVDWGATAGNSCDTSTIGTPSATLGRWRCSISASINVEDATCILRAFVSAADTITIKRCNVGAGACADADAATHYVSCVIQ